MLRFAEDTPSQGDNHGICVYVSIQYAWTAVLPPAVTMQAPLTLVGSWHDMSLRKDAVPAALQSLELNSWQDLTMEGTPSTKLWADATVMAFGAALRRTAETTWTRVKGALMVWIPSVACAITEEGSFSPMFARAG